MGVVLVSGCTSNNNTTTDPNTITIQNNIFNPNSITIPQGTTITWINKDSNTHKIVSDTGLFTSPDLSNGQSYSYTFTQAGTYPYHCSLHPNMVGTIIVQSNTVSTTTKNTSTRNNSNVSPSNNSSYNPME
jgi:plastocyanin